MASGSDPIWLDWPSSREDYPTMIIHYGLIRSPKLGNKEQEWMADFPSRDVMC